MPFDLTTEPWIPVRSRDGQRKEVGLRELFARAHELECVDDPSPLVTLALYRLLIAVVLRVDGPASIQEWIRLYKSTQFSDQSFAKYFDRWRERLDLLHPERPFYQTRGLPKEYEADGLGRLILERSNYGAPSAVFQHRPTHLAKRESLPLATAARHLLALHAFAPGGLVKKAGEPGSATAGPLNRGAYGLVVGRTLFETLVLNTPVYNHDNDLPFPGDSKRDVPSWEQDPLLRPTGSQEPKRSPFGYVDWLTWQSRRVELRLTKEGDGALGLVYCVGKGVDRPPQDPMLAYRTDKSRGLVSVDLSETRALWRDSHAFLCDPQDGGTQPPRALTLLRNREVRMTVGAASRGVLVLGMRGDQAAIKLSRAERLYVPWEVLSDAERASHLREASHVVERIGVAVRMAAREGARQVLSPGDRDPHKDDIGRLCDSLGADRTYWSLLATGFTTFLRELADSPEAALAALQTYAERSARTAVRTTCGTLGSGARHAKALAAAELTLERALRLERAQEAS